MTGARGEYPRPDMRKAPGAMAPGPRMTTADFERAKEEAHEAMAEAQGRVFWDRVAQSHRRLGRRR
jgi:hypothetical protein